MSTKSSVRRTKSYKSPPRRFASCVQLTHREGFHTRPAARFVAIAQRFPAVVEVCRGKWRADGKSILGLLALGAKKGQKLIIATRGQKAQEALQALTKFIRENL